MIACEGVVCCGSLHNVGDMNTRKILVVLGRVCTITCPCVGGGIPFCYTKILVCELDASA